MQTYRIFKLGMAVIFSLALVACASSDTEDTSDSSNMPAATDNQPTQSSSRPAQPQAADPNAGLTPQQIRERDAAMNTTVFYFEFDRSDLSAEARSSLVFHANFLKANPSTRYRLEGHADERGTREYNLALGERRAQAVERYLQVQGVSSGQLETISYGEERPVDTGTTEAAYARNRRVEIH